MCTVDVDGLVLGIVHYSEPIHAAHTDPAATDSLISTLWSSVYTDHNEDCNLIHCVAVYVVFNVHPVTVSVLDLVFSVHTPDRVMFDSGCHGDQCKKPSLVIVYSCMSSTRPTACMCTCTCTCYMLGTT